MLEQPGSIWDLSTSMSAVEPEGLGKIPDVYERIFKKIHVDKNKIADLNLRENAPRASSPPSSSRFLLF